jgi:2-polyprenyl-3-methyl-5-hydroxy-6-metoxy-1,4-benzoquinol methylase
MGHRYYRCAACGLVSTYPLPDASAIEAHYARKFASGNYELRRRYEQPYRAVNEQYLELLKKRVLKPNPSILDVGCFTGDFLELLNQNGWDVCGVELQPEAVEIANARLPGRVFQTDLYGGNFPRRHFDVVSLLGLIEHVADPMRMLFRCVELLAPGGVLLIQTPDSGSLLARGMRQFWPPYAPVEHIHLFSRRAIKKALSQVGLGNIRVLRHVKKLPIAYVYEMLQNFGPEFYRLFGPFFAILPPFLRNISLPFYVGEMLVIADMPSCGAKNGLDEGGTSEIAET